MASAGDMFPKRTVSISMNVVDQIMLDHECFRNLYEAFKLPATDAAQKQCLAWAMINAQSMHTAREEMVLYPAVRAAMGDTVADECLREHATIKMLSASLDTMQITDPNFEDTLNKFYEEHNKHMLLEETQFLPTFQGLVTPLTLLQLGVQFEIAKIRAPTRPHPDGPNLPPLNETANAAAKQMDTVLDQARYPSVVPPAIQLNAQDRNGQPMMVPTPMPPATTEGSATGAPPSVMAAAAGEPVVEVPTVKDLLSAGKGGEGARGKAGDTDMSPAEVAA